MKYRNASRGLVLAAAAIAAAGCEQGRETPPEQSVTVVHAAPSFGTLLFLREEDVRRETSLGYKGSSAFSYDVDQYDFNVERMPIGASARDRIASFPVTMTEGNDYRLVLAEAEGEIEPLIVETPVFETANDETEVVVVHAGAALGPVDVYLEAPDADVAAATPFGGLDFLEQPAPATVAAGDYRVTLTAPGDPATVLFESSAVTLDAGASELLVLADGAGEGLADVNVLRIGAASSVLIDRNLPAGLRVINAVADGAVRDIYVDGDFSAPAVGSLAFGAASNHVTVAPGTRDLAVTREGDPNVEHEESESLAAGSLHTWLLTAEGNEFAGALAPENRRPLADAARVHLLNGATQFGTLGFFIVEPGTEATSVAPVVELAAPELSVSPLFLPGDYEVVLVDRETLATVAGPVPVTFEAESLYGILAVNGAGGATAEVVLLDDFD